MSRSQAVPKASIKVFTVLKYAAEPFAKEFAADDEQKGFTASVGWTKAIHQTLNAKKEKLCGARGATLPAAQATLQNKCW